MQKEELTGKQVSFKDVPFYMAGEETSKAGIIVIQEWWGVSETWRSHPRTDHIKRMTQRFADQVGALAITPDLYRGKLATKPDEAHHLMQGLDWPRAVEDVRAGYDFLTSKGVKKVGVVGFCMGGALTIASAAKIPQLSAASCFYGIPPAHFADPKMIKLPTQCHFGENDHSKGFSDKEAALGLKQKLQESGQNVSEFYIHPDADHAFMNEDAPAYPYNQKVALEAMRKTVSFFKKHLL